MSENNQKLIQVKVYGYFPINIPDEIDSAVARGRAKQYILDTTLKQQGQQMVQTFIIEKVETVE